VAASEDDEAMVEKLESEPDALAIEGFAVFDQHRDSISAVAVAGVKPESATIADDSYPISRPLYLYVKKARVGLYPGIEEFLTEFTSDEAWGEGGYLNEIGLVPMAREMRRRYAADAKNLKPLSM
jgi:phosphate transport system substrate-binding protein